MGARVLKMSSGANSYSVMPDKMLPSADSPHILVGKLGISDQLYWDAAVMLGLGRMDELRSYIKEIHGHGSESSYSLGIGMSRLDGDKVTFDDLAVEFAVNLGVNPPNWMEQHSKAVKTEIDMNAIVVSSLVHDTIVDTTIKMESPWPIRLDLSKVADFSSIGLELFNESMNSRLDRKLKTIVTGGDDIFAKIHEFAKANSLQISKSAWMYMLSFLKLTNKSEIFSQVALEYMNAGGQQVTFENLAHKVEEKSEVKLQPRGIPLGDKLASLNQDLAQRIIKTAGFEKHIGTGLPIVIDLTLTKVASLIDINCLIAFFNEFSGAEVKFHFANVNEIILGILRAIGVNEDLVRLSAAGGDF